MTRPAWPFDPLRPLSYGLILADPPWRIAMYSAAGEAKAPQGHYECMDTAAIERLPVGHLAGRDAVLLLWATFPMLPEALKVMAAWGFKYKTGAAWAKRSSTGKAWSFGTGYILRSAAELLLVGTLGAPAYRSKSQRNLIVAPVREHSRKPDQIYDLAEALCDAPRCELFARQRRPGWDAWGNQVERFEAARA